MAVRDLTIFLPRWSHGESYDNKLSQEELLLNRGFTQITLIMTQTC